MLVPGGKVVRLLRNTRYQESRNMSMACGHLLEGLPVELSHEQRITWMALLFTTGSISRFVRIFGQYLDLLTMICC